MLLRRNVLILCCPVCLQHLFSRTTPTLWTGGNIWADLSCVLWEESKLSFSDGAFIGRLYWQSSHIFPSVSSKLDVAKNVKKIKYDCERYECQVQLHTYDEVHVCVSAILARTSYRSLSQKHYSGCKGMPKMRAKEKAMEGHIYISSFQEEDGSSYLITEKWMGKDSCYMLIPGAWKQRQR